MDEGQATVQVGEIQKQLTVIQALPALTRAQVDDIGGRLGDIYRGAEQLGDNDLMTTVADTWAIIQANPTTTAVASAALTGLIEAVRQRDSALNERDQLLDGISELESEGETKNPRLRGAAHVLYEALRERWEEEVDGYVNGGFDCPGCTAVETGWDEETYHDAINIVYGALFDELHDRLPHDLREEFGDFLIEWTAKVEAYWDKEFAESRPTG